jgi:ubiquinone/menaquinone biosynthesis C-methylase UbiE
MRTRENATFKPAPDAEGRQLMDYADSTVARRDSFHGTEKTAAPPQSTQAPAVRVGPTIPSYLEKTYHWAYLDSRNARFLDHEWIVKTILWRQHRRLEKAAFTEIEPGQHVLQSACVYGDFSKLLAEHIGPLGKLEIVDVADVQVSNCRRKLAEFKHATVRHENVLHLRDEAVDVVCCYFLMHELPNDYKRGVAAVLLNSVRPGGKLVFVDYHKPHWAHPLKLVTSLVFDTLEPYAKDLWRTEIKSFAGNDRRFTWQKETYFGGLFQKVVATRKT